MRLIYITITRIWLWYIYYDNVILNKAIGKEHVLTALKELEYDNFIPFLEQALSEFKGTQKIREKRDSKFRNSGLSEEELLRQQEELFRKSRSRLHQTTNTTTPTTTDVKQEPN